MSIFIGIDGGGTSLKAIIGDTQKRIIGSVKCGPVNYQSVGIDKVKESFSSLFNLCKTKYRISLEDIKCICLGCAGVNNKRDEYIYDQLITASLGYKGKLMIYNDAYIALIGAVGYAKSGILISGTGSIAYGINKNGSHVRVGGWGHIIGDEGSAYSIARDALNAVTLSIDGIIPYTKLTGAIMERLKIKTSEELMNFVYNPNTQKHHIAQLAPVVIEMANMDKVAGKIVDKSANDLYNMVYGLNLKMDLDSFELALSGSVLTKTDVIKSIVISKIKEKLPKIIIVEKRHDPAYGALTLAWKEAAI